MDDQRFDAMTRSLAQSGSRRSALKALLGIGGVSAASAILLRDVDAARRGAPTPLPPPPATGVPPTATPPCAGVLCSDGCCNGQCTRTGACCPAGNSVCGTDCCPNGQATCCDGACCYGVCYGEELCCPAEQMCGAACCAEASERCCTAASGIASCIALGACCDDADCPGGRCQNEACVANTPTHTPSATPTAPPTNTPSATHTPSNTATAPTTPTATQPVPRIDIQTVVGCRVRVSFTQYPLGERFDAVLSIDGVDWQMAQLGVDSSGNSSWLTDTLPCGVNKRFDVQTSTLEGESLASGSFTYTCDCD